MNDLGVLASNIITYQFERNDKDHPISFVSGWLDANVGLLNGYANEEFVVTGAGYFSPSLEPVEKAIFTTLYVIDYYDRMSRKALHGSLNSYADWTTLREGDSVIQKSSKHAVSRTFKDFRDAAKDTLKDLVQNYNIYKSSPLQVAGADSGPFTTVEPRGLHGSYTREP